MGGGESGGREEGGEDGGGCRPGMGRICMAVSSSTRADVERATYRAATESVKVRRAVTMTVAAAQHLREK